jgi:hypothetical protein
MKKLIKGMLMGLTIAVALVGLNSSAAGAASWTSWSGATGPVGINEPGATCWVRGFPTRDVYQVTPTIYAHNYYAGAGNDAQWVHFRTKLVDTFSRQTLAYTGWSGWSKAWDNSPAPFSGQQSLRFTGRNSFVVQVDVEWWNSTTRLGSGTLQDATLLVYGHSGLPAGSRQANC